MGNLCSRSANPSDPFTQPGRVLGSAPEPGPARAPVPVIKGPGRTLGGAAPPPSGGDTDARNKAAEAAQKRAEALSTSNRGKLGSQLAAQKAQTRTQTLNETSQTERAARDADHAEQARRWD